MWEQPESGTFAPDPQRPRTPTEVMDLALAKTSDKKAFRAAKREAENFVGLLLRANELPEPEVVIAKLDASVSKLQLTLKGI